MPKINVLPKNVAELIAAGEVVERPSSAVKEMLENSIDAGASAVTVEIKNGGIRYIRVTDNGCGIHREDVRTAFISHATSKISTGEDLDAIFTLGFRGEALPSIAAVSRLSMMTRAEDDETGTAIEIHGGEEISFDETGCPIGTTVIIRDLFFNTPARMKFLKKDMTEGTYVSDVTAKAAISHPEVKFTLIKDGRTVLSTPGNGRLLDTVFSVFGKDISDSLIPVDYEYNSFKIKGFISRPLNNRPNRNMQYFYVNGRYVRIPVASAALDEAYKNSIMVGKFPVCFLFIDLPAGKIDVNVHPAKTEIRFSEDSKVFEAVFYSARSALNKGDTARPEVTLRERRDITAKPLPTAEQLSFQKATAVEHKVIAPVVNEKSPLKTDIPSKAPENIKVNPVISVSSPEEKKEIAAPSVPDTAVVPDVAVKADVTAKPDDAAKPEKNDSAPGDFKPFSVPSSHVCGVFRDTSASIVNRTPEEEVEQSCRSFVSYSAPVSRPASIDISADDDISVVTEKAPAEKNDYRIVGEVFRTYIFVEQGEKLLIIDKHAAHERMIFNTLSKTDFSQDSQLLLLPVSVTLSAKEYAAVIENLEVFRKGGFMVDDFGDGAVVVRGFPLVLSKEDIPLIITEMAGELLKGKTKPVPEKLQWLYHSASCRAAIKAGDALKEEETSAFVEKLLADEGIRYCPHGRPVMYELSKHEIEKQFGRV